MPYQDKPSPTNAKQNQPTKNQTKPKKPNYKATKSLGLWELVCQSTGPNFSGRAKYFAIEPLLD
jgi:hypothetical protein